MAIDAGRSPSGVEKAYVAAVPSRKKLGQIFSMKLEIMVGNYLQSKEDEDFRPDTSAMVNSIDPKGLECRQHDKDRRPSVVQREWKMDENLIGIGLRRVVLLDDIVDMLREQM